MTTTSPPLLPKINQVDYSGLSVDQVWDCTGVFLTRKALQPYFDKGVPKVVVSAPVKDAEHPVLNIVYGVNHVSLSILLLLTPCCLQKALTHFFDIAPTRPKPLLQTTLPLHVEAREVTLNAVLVLHAGCCAVLCCPITIHVSMLHGTLCCACRLPTSLTLTTL